MRSGLKTASLSAIPLFVLLSSGVASAHMELTSPAPRLGGPAGQNQLKNGPCGQNMNARTDTVTEFMAGETITVEFNEYIDHSSYYRISFDVDGDDDFTVQADMDSIDPGTDDPEATDPIDDVILAYVDDDSGTGDYSVEITLPNVACDNCTLQVIQFMYDKVGNGMDDEYYFQCADITLIADDTGSGGADGEGGNDGAGGSDEAGGSTGDGGSMMGTGGDAAGGSNMMSAGGDASSGGAAAGGATSAGGATASGGTAAGGLAADTGGTDTGAPVEPIPGEDDLDEGGCSIGARNNGDGTLAGLFAVLGLGLLGARRRRLGS